MLQILRFLVAAELMVRFIARLDQNYWKSVAALGGCRPGDAKITHGYNLPARFVIHTVGPIWSGGGRGEAEIFANCYRRSLEVAIENQIQTVAFPAISCGGYRYPVTQAARIALETTRQLLGTAEKIDKVTFVLATEEIFCVYQKLL